MFKKLLLAILIIAPLFIFDIQPSIAEEPKILTLEQHIQRIFGDKAEVATAVLKHESGLKLDAINYNCRYDGKSTFCKKGDRKNAISVDCGISQVNFKGKVCPPELLTLEGNMAATEIIYKEQGLKAWASYNNKKYKMFI